MTPATITSLAYLTLGILIILLGMIILRENFRQTLNRITGVMLFFAGLGPIFGAFGLLLQNAPATDINLQPFRNIFILWEFFFPQMLLFSMVFPREFDWTKRHKIIKVLIFLPHLVHFILINLFSSPEQVRTLIDLQALSDRFGLIVQPLTILLGLFLSLLGLIYEFHTNFFALINLIYIVAAIALMMLGYRRLKNPRLKKQVSIVLWGIRASVGLYAIAFIFPHLNILHTSLEVQYSLTAVALMIGSGSIAWSIIRYQFLDIRFIIRRGLIISLASGLLIGIYLMVYNEGKKLISGRLDLELPLLEIFFIIVALVSYQPILSGVESIIQKLFMRDSLDYRNILQNLSHDIMTTLEIPALQEKLTGTLKKAMSLSDAHLLLAQGPGGFTARKGEKTVFFDRDAEWIMAIKEEAAPIGFDELSLRVSHSPSMDSLRSLNAFLIIPFIHRDDVSGILVLGEKIAGTSFTTEDMTILNVLSNQAAIALENANLYQQTIEKQRMEEELSLARDIQMNLLPAVGPSGPGFELAGYNLPSKEVGGDYYDFVDLHGRIGIAIGDIAGKGIPAAMLMANLQAALRISAARAKTTSDVLHQVNDHITRTTPPERFATFFYGVFDPGKYRLDYTNAGHNFPLVCRKQGGHVKLKEGGLILGIMEKVKYRSGSVTLAPGDIMVLYTDGVTEAMNGAEEEYGENRLLKTSQQACHLPAQAIIDTILESVINFTHGNLQTDDLTLVVLKTT
jgi:sigma-B regulation protein RsbU (phosphoserine phosphatase)